MDVIFFFLKEKKHLNCVNRLYLVFSPIQLSTFGFREEIVARYFNFVGRAEVVEQGVKEVKISPK